MKQAKCISQTFFILFLVFVLVTPFFTPILFSQTVNLAPEKSITQYTLKSWTIEEGLASNALNNVIQSKDGYIWIASFGGIFKFDGVDFTTYNSVNTKALFTEAGKMICEDKNDVLWIGTQKGISLYKNNVFFRNKSLNRLNDYNIESLFCDEKNHIWIGTNSNGLFKYEPDTLIHFDQFSEITTGAINDVYEDKKGNVWIGTIQGELIKYKNEKFTVLDKNNTTSAIYCFYEDNDDLLWIGANSGVFVLENNKLQQIDNLSMRFISHIVQDSNGLFWISSISNGIARYNKETGIAEYFSSDNGLPNNRVKNLLFDFQGNLWGATYRNGLFQITSGKFTCFSKSEGLSSNIATATLQYDDDSYWIATEDGNINILKNGIIKRLKTKIPIPSVQIKQLFKDSKNNIWISTYGGLIKKTKDTEIIYNKKNGFPGNYIRLCFEDSKGNIWVGTNTSGILKINKANEVVSIDMKRGLSSEYVMAIAEDKYGNIIAGTKNGINIIKNDTVIKSYTTQEGLPGNLIFNIYKDEDDILWISTNSGICRMQDSLITNYSIESGLYVNTIFDILEDNMGSFWMPGPKGIMKIEKKQLNQYANGEITKINYKFFDKSDGMKSSVCLGATKSIKTKDGKLWFNTAGGVAIINPSEIKFNKEVSPVIIEKININGKIYNNTEIIRISSKFKRFEIKYTALDYISPEKIKFRYKLEPFEQEWVDANTKRSVSYTNINPGEYSFKVFATNSFGFWGEEITSLSIVVLPAWYQTWLLKIILLLVIIALIIAGYKINTRNIARKNTRLEKMVKERTTIVIQQKEEIEAQKELLVHTNLELEKLSLVASKTNNAITIMDAKGTFEWVNEGFEKFYELTLREFQLTRGKNIFECSNDDKIIESLRKCIQNKVTINYEFSTYTKTGKKVYVQTTITPIINDKGAITKLISIDTDISKLKTAEIEIIRQRDEIITQQVEITDSIVYSKHIQTALFPTTKIVNKIIPHSFIINLPREIIGGDFYWLAEKDDKKIIIVADCTGHGVPGALMSMLGISLLNDIVVYQGIVNPGKILNQLRTRIIQILHQDGSEESSQEGLDIAICVLNENKKEIEYAGANNPIIIVGKDRFIELLPDKMPVRLHHTSNTPFSVKTEKISEKDTIFLFSDGFADQFGGDESKKFRKQQMRELFKNVALLRPNEQKTTILSKFNIWKGNTEQIDDILILGFSII